mmetsp:Transcript_11041/g.12524  ORF Transcript_11041/g.12524 Transcript_11041/m.12524 type:complete len:229 (+) Transcript_11041:415-1101(+)
MSALAECARGVFFEKELQQDISVPIRHDDDKLEEEVAFLVHFGEAAFETCFNKYAHESYGKSRLRALMSEVIRLYCAAGKSDVATQFMSQIMSQIGPNASSYNALIWGAACVDKNVHKAITLVGDMQSAGVSPNSETVDIVTSAIISRCFSSGQKTRLSEEAYLLRRKESLSEAMGHLVSLCNLYEIKPWDRTIRFIQNTGAELGMENEVMQMFNDANTLREGIGVKI